jgi:RNA polymerase sigma-70 factor (ECF subfamily)
MALQAARLPARIDEAGVLGDLLAVHRQVEVMDDQLFAMNESPVVALNRAVAIARVRGPAEALAAIESLEADPKLRDYYLFLYLFLAVRGYLLLDLERRDEAASCFRAALECRCSEPERRFLRRKLAECEACG